MYLSIIQPALITGILGDQHLTRPPWEHDGEPDTAPVPLPSQKDHKSLRHSSEFDAESDTAPVPLGP